MNSPAKKVARSHATMRLLCDFFVENYWSSALGIFQEFEGLDGTELLT